jgi:outer membrane murein-binding lipoprotein Lpp
VTAVPGKKQGVGQPAWRRAFDRVERMVGKPLEDMAGSRRYTRTALARHKVHSTVRRQVRRAIDRPLGPVLRLAGMPTRAEVQKLSAQVATLTGEVRELAHEPRSAAPKPAARKPPAPRSKRAPQPKASVRTS